MVRLASAAVKFAGDALRTQTILLRNRKQRSEDHKRAAGPREAARRSNRGRRESRAVAYFHVLGRLRGEAQTSKECAA